jgi:hypothetical protein
VMAIKEARTRQWVVGVENPSVLLLVLFYSNSYSIWLLTIVFLYWLIEDQVRWALDLPRGLYGMNQELTRYPAQGTGD